MGVRQESERMRNRKATGSSPQLEEKVAHAAGSKSAGQG